MKEEALGLSVLQEDHLKCGDCYSDLLEIAVIETNEARQKRGLPPEQIQFHVLKCYKCGGQSFNSPVYSGTVITGPPQDNVNIDIVDFKTGNNNVPICEVETKLI